MSASSKNVPPPGLEKLNLRGQPVCFASSETLFFPSWHSWVNFYTVTASTNVIDWTSLGKVRYLKHFPWNLGGVEYRYERGEFEGLAGFGKLTPSWKDALSGYQDTTGLTVNFFLPVSEENSAFTWYLSPLLSETEWNAFGTEFQWPGNTSCPVYEILKLSYIKRVLGHCSQGGLSAQGPGNTSRADSNQEKGDWREGGQARTCGFNMQQLPRMVTPLLFLLCHHPQNPTFQWLYIKGLHCCWSNNRVRLHHIQGLFKLSVPEDSKCMHETKAFKQNMSGEKGRIKKMIQRN